MVSTTTRSSSSSSSRIVDARMFQLLCCLSFLSRTSFLTKTTPITTVEGFCGSSRIISNRNRRIQHFSLLNQQQEQAKTTTTARMRKRIQVLYSKVNDKNDNDYNNTIDEEVDFIKTELAKLESLDTLLSEIAGYEEDNEDLEDDYDYNDTIGTPQDYVYIDNDEINSIVMELSGNSARDDDDYNEYYKFDNLYQEIFQTIEDDEEDDEDGSNEARIKPTQKQVTMNTMLDIGQALPIKPPVLQRDPILSSFENALQQGVVPVSAGVGSYSLPGDFGFDPLDIASKDYFKLVQSWILQLFPIDDTNYKTIETTTTSSLQQQNQKTRPKALILRDYREAEIRHSRLAMIAAIFWPVQEMLDKLLLGEEKCSSILQLLVAPENITLPYIPLLMTAIMLLLGYLDIYSQSIKDMDKLGDAFLPGDCFWDPLNILPTTQDNVRMETTIESTMKRNMQERELFNGRVAMIAISTYIFEEITTHQPIINIPGNEILFTPIYQMSYVQQWLDARFT